MPWLFFYYLGLIALKDPKESLSKMEIGFSCLALFSTGTAILLIPVFMYRCYLRKKQPCLSRDLFLLLLICGTVLSTIFLLPREWQLYQRRDYYAYGSAYIRSLAQSGFIQPWLGDQITFFLMKDEIEFYSIGLILLASFGLLVQAFRGKSSQAQTVLFLLFASVSSFPVLTGMTRPNVLFAWTEPPTAWFFKHRYAFPLAFIAVFFWVGFFSQKKNVLVKNLVFVLMGVSIFSGIKRFRVPPYGPVRKWAQIVGPLQNSIKHSDPSSVLVQVYPEGWGDFVYTAAKIPESSVRKYETKR